MPTYIFQCDRHHETEQRADYETRFISCRCGLPAERVPVYRDQYMMAETGPKGGKRNEPPRDEKDLRKPFREFHEASQEMDYAYSRVDDPKVKAPNYYKEGVKQAKKRGAKIK